jgi:hypothetical protein
MIKLAPLAYRYVAVAAMLAELNFCSDQLNLPVIHPIDENTVTNAIVYQPTKLAPFCGRIDTADYMFSFIPSGKLRLIQRIHMWDGIRKDIEKHLSRIKAVVDADGVSRLARDGLRAIDVDVDRLDRDWPVTVRQRSYFATNGLFALPLFDVKWGDWQKPVVFIVIAGNSGDFLALHLSDDTYSHRPKELLRNEDDLLAISDEEFLKYTPEQRSNLLSRFLAVKYPPAKHLAARPILPYEALTATNSELSVPSGGVPHR